MNADATGSGEDAPIKTCCLLARPSADFLMWYRELAKIDGVDLEPGANASMVESGKQGFIFVDEGSLENLVPFVGEFWFYALTPLEYKDSSYILKQLMDSPKQAGKKNMLKTKETLLLRWTGEELDEKFWAEEWSRF